MADTFREFYLAMADELDHNRQCLMDDRSLTHPLADRARAAMDAAPVPVGGPSDEVVEDAAQVIYGSMRFDRIDSTSDWIPNGNSLAQDEARRCARAVLARYGTAPPPASDREVAELVAALRTEAEAYAKLDTYRQWGVTLMRAAALLERQHPRPSLPPRVGHILRLAEIIRAVDGNHDKGAAALAEAILSHPDVGMVLAQPRPVPVAGEEYHSDMGPVTWWRFPIVEPPWVGTPNDSDWPGYHTHFTPCPPVPEDPHGDEPAYIGVRLGSPLPLPEADA